MKKFRKEEFIKIIIIMIPVMLGIFLGVFAVSKFTTSRTVDSNPKYALSAERQANYDKLKISYVILKSRTTGTASFSSGEESDMNGKDVSPDDDYVRTSDTVNYMLEVGIEKNPNTTEIGETFQGGVIKVKATIPREDGETYSNISFGTDSWMKEIKYNSGWTEITCAYYIPSDKTAIGGTQQLSFTVRASRNKGIVDADHTPIFEVWMEGNKPDNSNSLIESQSVSDPNPIYVTGQTNASVSLSKGKINNQDYYNGVKGQYVNFVYSVSTSSSRGYSMPVNDFDASFKVEYYYREYNTETNTPGGWIKVDAAEDPNDPAHIIMVASGRTCESTPGFWPGPSYNTLNNTNYCASKSYTWSDTDWHEWDSGTITSTLDGNVVTLHSEDFYARGNYNTMVANIGYEFFVPWYEPVEGFYEYQIKITPITLTYEDELGTTYTKNGGSSITYSYKNDLTGNISYDLYGDSSLYNANNGSGYSYQYDFSENKSMPFGKRRYYYSYISVADGPYEGGVKRLIAWNSSYVDFNEYAKPYFTYSNNGIMPTPSTSRATFKYGIYKANPSEGTLTDDEVNATKIEDYDWYDSIADAKENGKIVAILGDEPDWRGQQVGSYLYLSLQAIDNINNMGKSGIIRQRIYVYSDTERTKQFTVGDDITYTPSILNEAGTGNSRTGTPGGIGETFFITGLSTYISSTITDRDINGNIKGTFSIEDEVVNLAVTPTFSSELELTEGTADFTMYITLPYYFKFLEGSSNIEPTHIENNTYNSSSTKITWEFHDWDLTQQLPRITYQAAISPYTPNNSYAAFSHYLYTPKVVGTKSTSTGIYIVNLAGAALRKTTDRKFLDKDVEFTITDFIYNISQTRLVDTKTFEFLPRTGDEQGSNFHGTYTIRIESVAEGQQIFYTTVDPDSLEYDVDILGNRHIRSIDIVNDDRFIEVDVGDIIPATATMMVSYLNRVDPKTDKQYSYTIIPEGNAAGDKYCFKLNSSSTNLSNAIHTEITTVNIAQRKITGMAFEDNNRNNVYDSGDFVLNNLTVTATNENGETVETTTDDEGNYEFLLDTAHIYTIQFPIREKYQVTPIGTQAKANKADSDGIIVVDHTGVLNTLISEKPNNNFAIRKKPSSLIINYLDINDGHSVADSTTTEVYYTETYEAQPLNPAPDNYYLVESRGDPVTEVVDKDTIEVSYYYELLPSIVTARHYIDGTTTKIHEDVVQPKKFTQPYETTRLDTTNLNYEYVRTDGDAESGIVSKFGYNVNYYYKLKTGTVTTHHYIYDNGETTNPISGDTTETWNYTETYTTSVATDIPNNYEFYKKTDNYTDVMSSPEVEVIYYYREKDSNLSTSISKTGTESITSKDGEVNYTITYNASIGDYIGNGSITIVDTLPYKIDLEKSDIAEGTYDEETKTITWNVDWNDIDTYTSENETATKEISYNLKLVYLGIVGRDRIMTNTTKGTITLSNNSREAQAQTSTSINITGKITVVFIEKDTDNHLDEDVEATGLVGDEYISVPIEKEGYKLVTKPDSERFEFEEEDQVVTYEYEHIKYEVKGVVLGNGGKISGDEDVFWGEDSTEGNIIVEADEGYYIETISINGEDIDIEKNQVKIILENFINVKEDKNIEVTFAKKPLDNPNTRMFISIIMIVIPIIFLYFFIRNYKKLKNLE